MIDYLTGKAHPAEECINPDGTVRFGDWGRIQGRCAAALAASSMVFAVSIIMAIGVLLQVSGHSYDPGFKPMLHGSVTLALMTSGYLALIIARLLAEAPAYVDARVDALLPDADAETEPAAEDPRAAVARIVTEQAA